MKKKAFILLEIVCAITLFMIIFLPFISLQKEILLFFKIKEEQYQERWNRKNAIAVFKKKVRNQKVLEGRYYYKNKNWFRTESSSFFVIEVKKFSLKNEQKEENIYFYQMFDSKTSDKLWEGWSVVEEKS
ncbi:MAG TPA: hypothetical protein VIG61_06000 [Fusobacterium sp.]|uniref:hypothetical protein n=1 Tax=Fusobacterium sp. TaxID=68766 RepID=UPI002F4014C6